MKNADPGANEKACEADQHMAAFKHAMALLGQRTLDLGRVRTASIRLSRLRMCQKKNNNKKKTKAHARTLFNQQSDPRLDLPLFLQSQLGVCPSPSPSVTRQSAPIVVTVRRGGGGGVRGGAQLPSIIH